ncbi:hypothetical protein B7R21_00245 [Subtercola boreus]|uniref:Uncharacterized protein n=1 Tax=Subtercola boreus TaxID=120213 RepID=A0A3E0W5D8_9MICO|nr:hypothetical protein [Subtercola boreus]RFA17211.1 hypothetical protein B7R21_00245 [Subtercola boreus]
MTTHAKLAAAAAAIVAIVLSGFVGPIDAAVAAGQNVKATVFIAADRTTLSDGQDYNGVVGSSTALKTTVEGVSEVFQLSGVASQSGSPYRSVAYQLGMLGKTTGYWLTPTVTYSVTPGGTEGWRAFCNVHKGYPGWAGTTDATQWNCAAEVTQAGLNTKITFKVSQNRFAEASGSIRTSGPVTLKDGTYDGNNLPYLVAGSREVGRDSGADFAVVMREGDKPVEGGDLARVRFSYRILDEGRETSYWVIGWSQTLRAVAWHHGAACFITDQLPGKNNVPLDSLDRQLTTPYQCTIQSEHPVNGDGGTYDTKLLVDKREVTTVDNPATAADLVRKYCSSDNGDCNVNLTDAKKFMKTVGDDRKWQAANDTDKPVWERKVEVETSVQTTHKYATEVTASAEQSFIGQKFAFTVKQSYGFEYQQKTDIKETIPVPVGPREITWVEYQVPMIVADGDVLIFARDQGINYRLPDVHVEMPQPGGQTPTLKCDRLAGWSADAKGASCFPGSSTPKPVPSSN